MNIENAVRTLTDLSALDEQLSDADLPEDAGRVGLRDRRAALRGDIPAVILTAYDMLARIGRRPVVVAVRSAHCGGCHLRLPPQLDASIRRRQSLSACPHCRRLLYPAPPPAQRENAGEPVRQTPVPAPPGARSGQRAQDPLSAKSRPKGRIAAARPVGRPRASQERVVGRRRSAGVREGSSFEVELSLQRS
jgi:hypothetical protein